MRKLFAMAALCAAAFGQDQDPGVSISGGPATKVWSKIYKNDITIAGADYLEYICYSRVNQPYLTNRTSLSGGAYTVTQIVDLVNTATVTTSGDHGLSKDNHFVVAGVTGDPDLNGTYKIVSVPSSTTFTFTSASVTDTTYNNSGITISSSAPRTNATIWAIRRFYYGGTGGTYIEAERWAVKVGNRQSTSTPEHSCDGRAALAYQ